MKLTLENLNYIKTYLRSKPSLSMKQKVYALAQVFLVSTRTIERWVKKARFTALSTPDSS